jgi:hypothetical protein
MNRETPASLERQKEEPERWAPRSSAEEQERRRRFTELFRNSPIPPGELSYSQLSVYLNRQELSRILFLDEIYRKILHTNGVILELGVAWGRTSALLSNLRGIHEPYNFTRKLLLFDTFEGLKNVADFENSYALAREGAYATSAGYEEHLDDVLSYHEANAPLAHLRKHEILRGDASETLPAYLQQHPETIVALAYFDFDIYKPTRDCLNSLKPHLCRNSILAFDQLNCPEFPGETMALRECLGNNYALHRSPLTPWLSYLECDFLA